MREGTSWLRLSEGFDFMIPDSLPLTVLAQSNRTSAAASSKIIAIVGLYGIAALALALVVRNLIRSKSLLARLTWLSALVAIAAIVLVMALN